MKFNRLNASIANNAREEPSVYMAVCAFESMLRDMEDETGGNIASLPAGSEMLSSKLVWLCRVVKSIYSGKSEELQRNRGRLDAAVKELGDIEQELGAFASMEDQYTALKQKKDKMEEQLQYLRDKSRECSQLQEQIVSLQKQIDEIQQFNPAAERARLQSMKDTLRQLEAEKEQLEQEAAGQQERQNKSKAILSLISGQIESGKAAAEALSRQIAAAESEKNKLNHNNKMLEEKKVLLSQQLQQLSQEKEELGTKLQQDSQRLSDYQSQNIDPILAELERIKIEIASFEDKKETYADNLAKQKAKRDELIQEIAKWREQCEEAEAAVKQKDSECVKIQGRLLNAKERADELQNRNEELKETLSALQSEVSELENSTLPEQRQLAEAEGARRDKLNAEFDTLRSGNAHLQEENDNLEAQLQEIRKDHEVFQKAYDELVTDKRNQSEEVRALEEKLMELQGKTDLEKHAIYKKQLEEKKEELERIAADLVNADEEISDLNKMLEKKQAELSELTGIRNRKQEANNQLLQRQKELEDIASPAFREKLALLEERLQLTNEVYSQMNETLKLVDKITDSEPLDEKSTTLLQKTAHAINNMTDAANQLQLDLIRCADTIRIGNPEKDIVL